MKPTQPIIDRSQTPYGALPFDKVTLPQIEQAIEQELAAFRHDLAAICQQPEAPTFANTIEAYERIGNSLDEAVSMLNMLESAQSDEAVEQLAERVMPHVSMVLSESVHEFPLWERVRQVADNPPADLTPEQKTLLDETVSSLVRSGCTLPKDKQQQFRQLGAQLTKHTGDFSRNLLHAKKDFSLHLTRATDLKGLPRIHWAAARMAAKERGLKGWLFTLDAPSYSPFMTHADNRQLRKRLYMAQQTLCTAGSDYDNEPLVRQLLSERHEAARLLGYTDYATYVLTRRMAQTPAEVEQFLRQLTRAYLPRARREVKAVREEARKDGIRVMQPWDFAYYSHRLRKRRFNLDAEQLRPYFTYENVREGIFQLANRLYGIRFERVADVPVYDKEVETYRVDDSDGSMLGLLYVDPFPRKGKQGGAWMTNVTQQFTDGDHSQRPHVAIVMNLTRPAADRPSLLTLGEVNTFLHEFGHALHGLFANTRYGSLSGTNVYWDFVELPSQFMENYTREADFLTTFARHYQTGEPLPEKLLEKVRRSQRFMAAYACIRQISFGLLDMALYHRDAPFKGNLEELEHTTWRPIQLLRHPNGTCMTVQFSHIMAGGYAAGYYSYKWAETLDADAFSLFQEKGLYNRSVAEKFRREILERGGTEHPMTLYQRFRGRKPSIDALLRRDGILPSHS